MGVAAHAGGWPVRAVLCASVFAELASGFTPPVGIQARVCVDLSSEKDGERAGSSCSGGGACVWERAAKEMAVQTFALTVAVDPSPSPNPILNQT